MEAQENDPLDRQVGGEHYSKGGIQPIHFTETNNLTFSEGNVVKYITRYKHKNGLQDLEKVDHYLDFIEKYSETDRCYSEVDIDEYCVSNEFNEYQTNVLCSMFNYLLVEDIYYIEKAKQYLNKLKEEYGQEG